MAEDLKQALRRKIALVVGNGCSARENARGPWPATRRISSPNGLPNRNRPPGVRRGGDARQLAS